MSLLSFLESTIEQLLVQWVGVKLKLIPLPQGAL